MKAIEDAIEYLEMMNERYADIIASELKLLLPTPRKSRSQDDDQAWQIFRDKNPGYWQEPIS